MNKFYVYGHYREDTDELFYIGKGCDNRANEFSSRSKTWVKCKEGTGVVVKKFQENMTNKDALFLEDQLINLYNPKANIVKTGIVKSIPYDKVNTVFIYDETSPTCLRWKIDTSWNGLCFKARAGNQAGTISKANKVVINYDSKQYIASRIIWVLHNKTLADDVIVDHINGDTSDNRIENLRIVSAAENTRNRSTSSRNKSGVTGVYFKNMKGDPYWTATWQDLNGKKHRVCFAVNKYTNQGAKSLAIEARRKAIEQLNAQGAGYTQRHNEVKNE